MALTAAQRSHRAPLARLDLVRRRHPAKPGPDQGGEREAVVAQGARA